MAVDEGITSTANPNARVKNKNPQISGFEI